MEKDLRKKLGIDDWLELVKEDRNCKGAYISFGQYMYLLEKDNQELKEQLEEINNFINKASFVNIEQLMLDYCAKVEQQKEFIEWLESMLVSELGVFTEIKICDVLSKYKETIGADTNEK